MPRRRHARRYLFCDTNAWTTLHWSLRSYGTADARLHELVDRTQDDYTWFLCANDFGWIQDGTREMAGAESGKFQEQQIRDLERRGIPYVTLTGPVEQRVEQVKAALGVERALAARMRRRLYLMRHAEVAYFDGGRPVDPRQVPLTEEGRAQAAGRRAALAGVRFDRVLTSGVPRTLETAAIVAPGQRGRSRGPSSTRSAAAGSPTSPRTSSSRSSSHAFRGIVPNDARFIRGESIGELFDRVLPALDRLLADEWDTVLAVLHGGVNRAILSFALTGERMFLGPFEQAPGLHQRPRHRWRTPTTGSSVRSTSRRTTSITRRTATTTMERYWAEYRR